MINLIIKIQTNIYKISSYKISSYKMSSYKMSSYKMSSYKILYIIYIKFNHIFIYKNFYYK